MKHASWLEVDLNALCANLEWWCALISPSAAADYRPTPTRTSADGPRPALGAVVKANAYGLGAVPISRCLSQAGVDFLIVYSPDQAQELLASGLRDPLLVLMPVCSLGRGRHLREAVQQGRLHLSLDDLRQIKPLAKLSKSLAAPLPVHLHLDTGMSRAGLSPKQFEAALNELQRVASLRLAGVYSHLATAPCDVGFIDDQLARLDEVVALHARRLPPETLVHISSTFAACRDRRYHRGLVRLGLGLYGYGPESLNQPLLPHHGFPRPIVRWLSRIVHVQSYPTGTSIGYDRTYQLDGDRVLGIVPVGYGDGYPVALSNRGTVRVLGPAGEPMGQAPVRGKVNMDQIIVDLTALPAARVGTAVELLSADHASPCSATALAAAAGTNCYEILCRLSPRLPRVLIGQSDASVQRRAQTAQPAVVR